LAKISNVPDFHFTDVIQIRQLIVGNMPEPYMKSNVSWNWTHGFVHNKFDFDSLSTEFQKDFLAQSEKIKKYTWAQSRNQSKSAVGNSQIPLKGIKPPLPSELADLLGNQSILSVIRFKYRGTHLPVVGITDEQGIFYVIWISRKRDDVYKGKK